jgi:hypothetical protein
LPIPTLRDHCGHTRLVPHGEISDYLRSVFIRRSRTCWRKHDSISICPAFQRVERWNARRLQDDFLAMGSRSNSSALSPSAPRRGPPRPSTNGPVWARLGT